MKTVIQSPEFKARPELVDFIQQKMDKLEQFSDRILEARVLLKLEKSDSKENKVCEVKLVIPGNDLFAKKNADTFEEATALTVEALRSQILTWKEKIQNF